VPKSFFRGVLVVIIMLAGGCASASTPSTRTPIQLSEADLPRLIGNWDGMVESWEVGGTSPLSGTVSLKIQDRGIAKFFLGTGENWDTIVQLKSGKAGLGFAYGYREFILYEGNGRLILEASYEALWQGRPRSFRIILTKR